jgi:hypothetical protein
MTDNVPPALAARPQFKPEYWAKIPRQTSVVHIERVTKVDPEWMEIVLKEGPRFRRKRDEIKQLLTANLEVHMETVNKELVTGLFVPGIGWAFRMTNEDLAGYTRDLSVAMYDRERRLQEAMEGFISRQITEFLESRGIDPLVIETIDTLLLSKHLLAEMAKGPQG